MMALKNAQCLRSTTTLYFAVPILTFYEFANIMELSCFWQDIYRENEVRSQNSEYNR